MSEKAEMLALADRIGGLAHGAVLAESERALIIAALRAAGAEPVAWHCPACEAAVVIDDTTVPASGRETWQPIKTAPQDGRLAIVYRPLAHMSGDQPVTIKRLVGGNRFCWDKTVPEGSVPTNPTDGACHVTHWMPLPAAPGSLSSTQRNEDQS